MSENVGNNKHINYFSKGGVKIRNKDRDRVDTVPAETIRLSQ